MECGLVLSSVTPWELIPKTKGETRGGYMCKYCKGYWRAGGGGTRLLQIRAGKAILQLVLDEPPEGLYNRWVKERLEYYRRVEPSAPLRDVSIVDQKVPRFRFSQTAQTGHHVSNAIWELILRNPEAAALKRIAAEGADIPARLGLIRGAPWFPPFPGRLPGGPPSFPRFLRFGVLGGLPCGLIGVCT